MSSDNVTPIVGEPESVRRWWQQLERLEALTSGIGWLESAGRGDWI